ncbi:MAG TPA: histidine kinase [Candidatus Pelethocola excrementipullorum]|nr:histidine kinase [Candidatus Pelethocola excrementipullorum]
MEKRVWGKFRQINLNKKVMYMTLGAFLLIFALCFLIIAFIFSYRERDQAKEMLLNVYDRIDTRLDKYVGDIDMASYTVMYSKWVQQLLGGNIFTSQAELQSYRRNASHFLSSYSSMNDNLKCFLVSRDHSYVKNNNSYNVRQNFDISNQEWYRTLEENAKYREYGTSEILDKNAGENSMTIYYQVQNIYTFKPMGVFVVCLEYDRFSFIGEMLNENEYVLIRDQEGNTVYSNMGERMERLGDLEAVQGEIAGDNELMLYREKTMENGWDIWILKENVTLLDSIRNNFYIFLIMIPVALVFMGISLMFSRYLTVPIVRCTKALKEVRNRNFNVVIPNTYKDEIGGMIDGFNDMSLNIQRLIDQNRLIYKSRQQAEFKILQQRINPHFLCNTLEIINGMILYGDDEKAVELTGMLGKMYRYDLGEDDIVPIREELSYLKNYLDILSYKYRNLQVVYEVDDEVLDCSILKFICQPLVENALKHGFRKKVSKCRIEIRIWREDDWIMIYVNDNGEGIKKPLLEELQEKIQLLQQDQATEINNHIGVLNTARRIFLQYGSKCYFGIVTGVNSGTRIEIHIPAKE